MRVRYAEAASRDVAEILAYIAADSPAAADAIDRAIVATIRDIARFPNIGRIGRRDGTRERAVPSCPYLIVYEVVDDVATILAILHGARDVPRVLDIRKPEAP